MMEPALVACPVCTLYLREGMSLGCHLDTHPKDQVIDALVRCVNQDRQLTPGAPHSSFINPFQVVSSEEHIFYGRQQVTNIIHAPLMSYPIYQQQSVLPNGAPEFCHGPEEAQVHRPDLQMTLPATGMSQGETITTLMAVAPANSLDYQSVEPADLSKREYCDPDPNYKSDVDPRSPEAPASPVSCHSGITVRTDLTDPRHAEEYITTDCYDFQDEDARHSDDLVDQPEDEEDPIGDVKQTMDETEDGARSDSGLNIQADECMPARGELSGHGSVNTTHSWDELIAPGPVEMWNGNDEVLKRFACLYCDESFTCPKERRIHVATLHCPTTEPKHQIDQKSMCVFCGLHVPSSKELKAHIKNEHKKTASRRQCTVCLEEFKTQEEYSLHLYKVHPLECRTCGKTFKTKSSLVAHGKIHLDLKPHACTLCPKTFITNQKLKEHMNGHTGLAPIQCNMCEKKFKRYSNLKQHKDSVHFQVKKAAKEHFCECGETFPTKKKLAWHKETHAEKPKQCMYCSERYVHSASLTRHIRKAHNSEYLPPTDGVKKKNVVCPICNLTFIDTSLRAHMKQHGTVKQFGCIVCGKKFYTKWNLNLHRWTHASRMSKPYKCTLCKSAFIRQPDLQAHIRSHYNNKPFTCNHCGKQFNRKHNWSRHEKEHLNEKKYTCNECGKTFHRHYYLVDHARIHTGAKPYSCHICNKTSSTKSNHNKHIRTHHARVAVNTEA